MNRPLWQRARKDFIKLVDDDKIPEEHKRLNLHYLRTLPYEAISTAKPIIVEAPEPEPDVMLFPAGYTIWYGGYVGAPGLTKTLTKPLYRSQAKEMYGDLSDDELKRRFSLFKDFWRDW